MLLSQGQARPAGLQAPPSPAGLRLSPLEALAERELRAAVSCGGGGSIPFRSEALAQQQPASCLQCAPASPWRSWGLGSRCWVAARELSALSYWTLILLLVNPGMFPPGQHKTMDVLSQQGGCNLNEL